MSFDIPLLAIIPLLLALLSIIIAIASSVSPKVKLWWAVVLLGAAALFRGLPAHYYAKPWFYFFSP